MTAIDIVAGGLLLLGSTLGLLGAVGIVRFPGTFARMHAATKPPTLGVITVALGVAVAAGRVVDAAFAVLIIALQLLTAPVGAHLLARAIRNRPSHGGDTSSD